MSRFNSNRFDSGGGTDLSFITATASDIVDGKIGADTDGEQVEGTATLVATWEEKFWEATLTNTKLLSTGLMLKKGTD